MFSERKYYLSMKLCVKVLLPAIAIALFSFSAGSAVTFKSVLRVSDGRVITFEEMVRELGRIDMVFVGEDHVKGRHHKAQLDIITALYGKRISLAIGLEMFRAENQEVLNRWVKGGLDTGVFIKTYYENWNFPWPLYRDIFVYSREKRMPMIGLNVPENISRKVSAGGFKSLTPEEMKELPPGISCDIDEKYMKFIKRAYEGHGRTEKSFLNFCEAQMVWDKTMAWRLIGYKKKNPSRTVVVLAGAGHSWKHGIPAQVKRESQYRSAVILPVVANRVQRGKVSIEDADYVLLD
jgi:uncharacterized iron-regulated protein